MWHVYGVELDTNFDQDLNRSVIDRLRTLKISPLKKVKRKAGYDTIPEEDTRIQMKRLHINDIADHEKSSSEDAGMAV